MSPLICLWMPSALANPEAAFLLLYAGILCVYAEFLAPGRVFPGAAGSVIVVLATAALSTFPVDSRGVSLMGASPVFFVLEARYRSKGILTFIGAAVMLLGSSILIRDPAHTIRMGTAAIAVIPFSAISSFLYSAAFRSRQNKTVDILN